MFLGRRIVDEGLERRVLCGGIGGVGGCVACDVDPFLDEVEDGVEGFLVLRIVLRTFCNLCTPKSRLLVGSEGHQDGKGL